MDLKWYPIRHHRSGKVIGAAAFSGDSLIVVSSFYEDKDLDNSGKVELGEKVWTGFFRQSNRALLECFTALKSDPDLWMKDPNAINSGWGQTFTRFGAGLIADGVYMAYFNQSVGKLAGITAAGLSANPIKSFVIKKGMEQAVKKSYQGAMSF